MGHDIKDSRSTAPTRELGLLPPRWLVVLAWLLIAAVIFCEAAAIVGMKSPHDMALFNHMILANASYAPIMWSIWVIAMFVPRWSLIPRADRLLIVSSLPAAIGVCVLVMRTVDCYCWP